MQLRIEYLEQNTAAMKKRNKELEERLHKYAPPNAGYTFDSGGLIGPATSDYGGASHIFVD